MTLPPNEPAVLSVAWAGQTESPNWFHVARDYTERWHHQQQIRLAVGQKADILSDELYQPVLDTFLRALPRAYCNTPAPVGTLLRFIIPDMKDGSWWLFRQNRRWQLVENEGQQPSTTVVINREHTWQLFTRNLPERETTADIAASFIRINGDEALGRQVLTMRAVMM